MSSEKRGSWGSRSQFILASIGSAVGLGNAWRFPGLAAKHGGGAFMLAYLIAVLAIGIPFLMMEISIGRKMHCGVPGALKGIKKQTEPIGWFAVSNAFVISVYYAVVFAWVILMAFASFKFASLTGDTEGASSIWAGLIKTTGTTSGYGTISFPVLGCLLIAWVLIYACIRNGTGTVGKVVKYTVFLPIICLVILAVKGILMPGAMDGLAKFFIPAFSSLQNADLWIDAIGQVFYSLSIMMAIMVAYGSFLSEDANVAKDAMIIAFSDFAISILSGIVLFTTMSGTGQLNNMTESGIGTAFIVYPQSIVLLTNNGVANAIFAFVFYFCLCTLAIDSAFSIIEGVSTALSDKFNLSHKKTTLYCCIVASIFSLWFVTGGGLAWLDIVDHWCNAYSLILVGILESITIGWLFNPLKVLKEVNRNTGSFKMPAWWFVISIKILTPLSLTGFFIWNVVSLIKDGGIYGAGDGYSLSSNLIGGWLIMTLCMVSGFIVKGIEKAMIKKGFKPEEAIWEGADDKENEEEDDDISPNCEA
ncbi:MAG: sodium-dependent transporter [Lachnospiraceae bacterium]|nr:sodium-dependent transporter [Lachnospiraceae bacterium]